MRCFPLAGGSRWKDYFLGEQASSSEVAVSAALRSQMSVLHRFFGKCNMIVLNRWEYGIEGCQN